MFPKIDSRPLVCLVLAMAAFGGLASSASAQFSGTQTGTSSTNITGASVNPFTGNLQFSNQLNTVPVTQANPPIYLGPTQPGSTFTGAASGGAYLSNGSVIPGSQLSQTVPTTYLGPTSVGTTATGVTTTGTTQSGTTTPGSTSASSTVSAGTTTTTTTSAGASTTTDSTSP